MRIPYFNIKLSIVCALLCATFGIIAPSLNGEEIDFEEVIRLATVPTGAEVTGIMVNDEGTLFFNAQHPGGANELIDDAKPAFIGYVADFDIGTDAVQNVAIPAEGERDKVHTGAGEYVRLANAGDEIGKGQVLGGVYNVKGDLMYISNSADFNGFVPLKGNRAYLYTAWEGAGRKGASAVSRLLLNRTNGRWSADLSKSEMLNLKSIDGGWILCYGSVSPWGSLLLAEEYFYYNTSLWNHPDNYDADGRPGFAGGNDNTFFIPGIMQQYLDADSSNPYRYGYIIELSKPARKRPGMVKRVALGRYSHENAVVMPDGRTVYLGDDDSATYATGDFNQSTGGGFYKFVADRANNLSSGVLYAAKVTQDRSRRGVVSGFDVEWIELGHGKEREIMGWIAEYDGIGVDDWQEGRSSFISDDEVNAWAEGKTQQDLNGNGIVEAAQDDRVAFLESRKAAGALGATVEWNKFEGVSADSDNLYLAISEIDYSMATGWGSAPWNSGTRDAADDGHISLDAEPCGAVFYAPLGDDWDVSRVEPGLFGRTVGEGTCDTDAIAGPDNLLGLDIGLLIAEDTGGLHPVDMLWLWK